MSVCVFAVIKLNLQEWRGTRGTLYKVLHERKVWESLALSIQYQELVEYAKKINDYFCRTGKMRSVFCKYDDYSLHFKN